MAHIDASVLEDYLEELLDRSLDEDDYNIIEQLIEGEGEGEEEEEEEEEEQYGDGFRNDESDDDDDALLVPNSPIGDDHIFRVTKVASKTMKSFNTLSVDYTFRPNPVRRAEIRTGPEAITALEGVAMDMVDHVKHAEGITKRHHMAIVVQTPQLRDPIRLPFRRAEAITSQAVEFAFERVLQSYEDFGLDATVSMNVIVMERPEGSGFFKRRRLKMLSSILMNERQGAVWIPKNWDHTCFARSLIMGMALADGDDKRADRIRKRGDSTSHRSYVYREVCRLHEEAGVPLDQPVGLPEVEKFQNVLPSYCIRVVSDARILFKGVQAPLTRNVYLLLCEEEHHYCTVRNLASLFDNRYYCTVCEKGYKNAEMHRCPDKCGSCWTRECPDNAKYKRLKTLASKEKRRHSQKFLPCSRCRRNFFGSTCLAAHRENGTCEAFTVCGRCGHVMRSRLAAAHECGLTYCGNCNEKKAKGHLCYLVPKKYARVTKDNVNLTTLGRDLCGDRSVFVGGTDNRIQFLFFDIESRQEEGEHVPNLLICQDDRGLEKIFRGETCVNLFLDYVLAECRHYTIIAHNLKGYDGYPITNALLNVGLMPEIIFAGGKLMYIEIPRIEVRFVDSFNFLVMPLASFPKAFGLNLDTHHRAQELTKGFFPHLFNTRANQEYVGPLPPRECFIPDGMSATKRDEFDVWYDASILADTVFDMRRDLVDYCRMDVIILRLGCLTFCKTFQELTNVNPMKHAFTMSSVCNGVYRAKYMPKETIPFIPARGYVAHTNHSKGSLEWLSHMSAKKGCRIQHAANQGEKDLGIPGVGRVDGYDEETNTAYEYNGCLFHGCSQCYPPEMSHPLSGKPMHQLLRETTTKAMKIRAHGYSLETMWECEWEQLKAKGSSLARPLSVTDRLKIRDAFYGGRTGLTKLYTCVGSDDVASIQYKDFTSLYPFVNKNGGTIKPYPTHHPKILTSLDQDLGTTLEPYYGFVHLDILPPTNLYVAPLPYRTKNGKRLLFPLCRTCAEDGLQEYCPHEREEERFLRGTWVTEEVRMSLAYGYKILQIHEVWHFSRTSKTLFTEYMKVFQKVKQEASGWPSWCKTEADKTLYIEDYLKHEGIALDRHKIAKNPPARQTAKYTLNVLWGGLGRKGNRIHGQFFDNAEDWFKLALDPAVDIHQVYPIKDKFLHAFHNLHEEFENLDETCKNTSVSMAAFTTYMAREVLWRAMEKVGRDLNYNDTDSLVYDVPKGKVDPLPIGPYFGDLTDEIPEDKKIMEFIACGAKNYSYTLMDKNTCDATDTAASTEGEEESPLANTVTKVRGIRLNCSTSKLVNRDTMRNMVFGLVDDIVQEG